MSDAQPPAEKVTAEVKRLKEMSHQAFFEAWTTYVQGGTDENAPREVQAAAFRSHDLASRTLTAVDRAARELKTVVARREGESKREHQARISTFRQQLHDARQPIVDAVEDLAADEAEYLAQLDDEAFAEEWTAFVQQAAGSTRSGRDYVQGLAFRSPEVAPRTQALSVQMMRTPEKFLPAAEGETRKAHLARVTQFRSRLEAELRFLQYTLNYSVARWGRMPTAPNYRLQAMRLLVERHPEEFSQLRNAVRNDAQKAREEVRRQRRAERRTQARPAT
ncbi:hypothetical protein [Streptomyces griseocarneus]|uniref:hypothetical protein n=1 Tax=Streptomyces griseocarneus TaxID=51201 RepID=UPI00167F1B9B|nr:hypothetical protein [Streptomyces griseocarneus]MBZ6476649.1 hypothetical protein [Streptomyces griseocarneus]GHG80132.1 hypothetical protein GCM10018779_61420 [Streptomyces griseocarneus]